MIVGANVGFHIIFIFKKRSVSGIMSMVRVRSSLKMPESGLRRSERLLVERTK